MDHLVPATIAQNGLDFDGALAGDPLCIRRIVRSQAPGNLAAIAVFHDNGIAPLKAAIDLANAGLLDVWFLSSCP